MPGFILHLGAEVICSHGGQAEPILPNPTVLVSGMPITTLECPYVIAGCCFPPPPLANGPCVVGEWVTGAFRVFAEGAPVLVDLGFSVTELSATPMIPLVTQFRVIAE